MKYGACKNCGDIGPLGLNDTCSEGCEPVRNGLPICSSPDDILLLQIEELLDRIDALEETLLENDICVACLKHTMRCTCEAPL